MYLYNITRSSIVDVWVHSEAGYCGVSKKHGGLFKEWHMCEFGSRALLKRSDEKTRLGRNIRTWPSRQVWAVSCTLRSLKGRRKYTSGSPQHNLLGCEKKIELVFIFFNVMNI